MRTLNKLYLLLFLIPYSIAFAQPPQPPPGGGTTPGAPASPIDDYIFLLIPLAIFMIVYFANKYRRQIN